MRKFVEFGPEIQEMLFEVFFLFSLALVAILFI